MTYVPELPGGVPGGDGELIFTWNRSDISQFDSASPQLALGTGGTPGNSTISVVAVPERGNVLRAAADGVSTDMIAVWLVTAPLVFPDTRRDLIIEVETADPNIGANRSGGIAFLCDGTVAHGFIQTFSSSGMRSIVMNNGTPDFSAVAGAAFDRGAFMRYHIRGDKPASAAPRVSSWVDFWRDGGLAGGNEPRRTGISITNRGNVNDMGANTTLGATWNTANLTRWGVAITSGNLATGPLTVDILDLRAYLV